MFCIENSSDSLKVISIIVLLTRKTLELNKEYDPAVNDLVKSAVS